MTAHCQEVFESPSLAHTTGEENLIKCVHQGVQGFMQFHVCFHLDYECKFQSFHGFLLQKVWHQIQIYAFQEFLEEGVQSSNSRQIPKWIPPEVLLLWSETCPYNQVLTLKYISNMVQPQEVTLPVTFSAITIPKTVKKNKKCM